MSRCMLAFVPVVLLCLTLAGCPPAGPGFVWSYTVPTSSVWGLTIEETPDTGVIMGGGFDSSYSMYALKLTAAGTMDWDVSYSEDSPGASEAWRCEARGLRQTADGGYIMLGLDGYILIKLDSEGNKEWSKELAPEDPNNLGHACFGTHARALWVCADNGYFAVGDSYTGGHWVPSVLKTDAAGNLEFCKVVGDLTITQEIVDGQQTADGGYVLTGSSEGNGHGYLAVLVKLDADGDQEWAHTYQDVANDHGLESYAVAQTADGGYIIGGEGVNNITKVSTYGCWLAKINSSGGQVWLRSYGHEQTVHYPNDLAITPAGEIIAVGHKGVSMDLSKFTASGNVVWNYDFGDLTDMAGKALDLTADGGCVVVASGVSGGTTVVAKVNNVFVPETK